MTTDHDTPAPASLAALASAAKPDRNRAVDAYRVLAMGAVALGHWMAIAISLDADGQLVAGNALAERPSLSWVSWLFQVMPLFFVVGGFSSAMSLDAHNERHGRPQDWVVARLRRMVGPTIVLATTWLGLLIMTNAIDNVAGTSLAALAAAGAVGAAIPLWFLANYTIDTAIAPYVLPAFRRRPGLVLGSGLAVFCSLEVLRLADVDGWLHHLPHLNWVLGWLLFQVLGFAWRDGLLPTGHTLAAVAAGLWATAIGLVALGPWPVAMVHFPGLAHSPTHPPTLALLAFGAAYSATAVALAPKVSAFLATSKRAWTAVVATSSFAMSVYLWHMTAAAAAGAVLYAIGWLPTAEIGTAAWWVQKIPLLGLSALVLTAIVAMVAKHERNALLAPRTPWVGGQLSMLVLAGVLSTAVKLWASPDVILVTVGMALVTAVGWVSLRPTARVSRSSAEVTAGSVRTAAD